MNLFADLERLLDDGNIDRTALIEWGGSITYGRLREEAQQLSASMEAKGIGSGDRVLVLVPMSIDLYRTLFACWHLGVVASFIDPRCDKKNLATLLETLKPQAIISGWLPRLLCLTKKPLRRLKKIHPRSRKISSTTMAQVDDNHPAIISPTSGSTGVPKLTVRSHGFLRHQGNILGPHLDLVPGQIRMTTLPVFALVDLAHGCTCVLPDGNTRRPATLDPLRLQRQISEHRVEALVSPPVVGEHLTRMGKAALRSLKSLHTGGAPVRPRLVKQLGTHLPDLKVTALYGSTEAEPIAALNMDPDAVDTQVAAGAGLPAGLPVPEIAVVLSDPSKLSHTMEERAFVASHISGEGVGEILVSGKHVIQGYLNGRGDAEHKIHVGNRIWHRTGDLGRFDTHGQLWLMGRASAKVLHQGLEYHPFAIEMAAESRAGVTCALGTLKGEPLLVVDGPIPTALTDWAQNLGIDRVISMPIPLDSRHQGKVAYADLNRRLEQRYGQ